MNEEHKDQLLRYIDEHSDDFVDFFQTLVRTISSDPPGDEKAMADLCATVGRQIGLTVDQYEAAPNRTNNVMRLSGTAGSPVLLFNSHLDTFPASNEAAWLHPPFAAEIHDGKIWGVGTRDMKAGLAAAMLATRTIVECGAALRGDILLTQTADHIRGGGELGVKYLVEAGLVKADFGVYTEANPPAKVEIASRGMVRLDINVHGYAKHTKYKIEKSGSGQPINAVLKAAKVIEAIEQMTFSNWSPHPFIPGPPVISVNRINGGYSDGMIPDLCTLRVDCRYLPGQSFDDVVADVQAVLDRLANEDVDLKTDISVVMRGDPCEISPTAEIVTHVQAAIEAVRGETLPLGGVGSTSDMRFIVNNAGIPMCKFMFPSSETGTNEFETIDDFIDTVKVYAVLILNVLH